MNPTEINAGLPVEGGIIGALLFLAVVAGFLYAVNPSVRRWVKTKIRQWRLK